LIDRFGPVPEQSESLIQTIRLRWLAKKIGFEKLVLRNNRLTCYFISDAGSEYFQSPQFTAILAFIQENSTLCKIREERNKLFLTFRDVSGIEAALEKLALIPLA
jgi:transcription-repair coupling factor (superfamily II helicase)